MKKLLIISIPILLAGSFFSSCENNNKDAGMKAPKQYADEAAKQNTNKENTESEENEKEEKETDKSSIVKSAGYLTKNDAHLKTLDNMQIAFKGETTASAKYMAYSKKAEEEGYIQIALLFKAASFSENVHAKNHKAILEKSGINVPVIKPEFSVKTTRENLLDAIKGETYEATTMYPEFMATADQAGDQLAFVSLNYAYKTEKKHKAFYEEALLALQNNTMATLPTVFYICPTCGNTYETKAPKRCRISKTPGEKFIKIISL